MCMIFSDGHSPGRWKGQIWSGFSMCALLALEPQDHKATTVTCTMTPGLRQTECFD